MPSGAPPSKAVVLLSGGLDSCTAAAMAKAEGRSLYALSFDYNQRHRRELEAASAIAKALGAREHRQLSLPIGALGGSSLTDAALPVPDAPEETTIGLSIPSTYVPARNTVFLALATAYAEVVDAREIWIGANALDYSGYPDCRPEFLDAFERVAHLGTKAGVEGKLLRIRAPLLRMTKKDIVRRATEIAAPIALTWSCYRGGQAACGRCESCVLRLKGFREAGLRDPILYEPLATNQDGPR